MLPADCEHLIWKAYFSQEVVPLLKRNWVKEIQEYVTEVYCVDENQAARLALHAQKYDFSDIIDNSEAILRVFIKFLNQDQTDRFSI